MTDGATAYEPTLQTLIDQTSLKWIFVGGKGGVGKTTTACCVAMQLAAVRPSVLLISTDPAHNLSDAFRQKFSAEPTLVNGFTNLHAMEVDPNPQTSDLARLEGAGGMLSDLAGAIPGIDEAMSFAEVLKQVQSMDYDCVVFDTAPTGHTLRLLQFPATLDKALGKLASMRGMLGGMLGQMMAMLGGPGGGETEGVMGKLDQLKAVVEEVNKQFRDPQMTTFVCVCIPEFLSLYETERLVQELTKFEIDTQHIVINQIIWPEAAASSKLLRARVKMQQKYLCQYMDLYEDFHIVQLPLTEEEIRGIPALREFSQWLLKPYSPPPAQPDEQTRIKELEEELESLKQHCDALEQQLFSR